MCQYVTAMIAVCISQHPFYVREFLLFVSEKSGKSQGILFPEMSGNPDREGFHCGELITDFKMQTRKRLRH